MLSSTTLTSSHSPPPLSSRSPSLLSPSLSSQNGLKRFISTGGTPLVPNSPLLTQSPLNDSGGREGGAKGSPMRFLQRTSSSPTALEARKRSMSGTFSERQKSFSLIRSRSQQRGQATPSLPPTPPPSPSLPELEPSTPSPPRLSPWPTPFSLLGNAGAMAACFALLFLVQTTQQ